MCILLILKYDVRQVLVCVCAMSLCAGPTNTKLALDLKVALQFLLIASGVYELWLQAKV